MNKTLVCRRCKISPELVREEGQRDLIRCPRCGAFGDREKVIRAAAEQVQRDAVDEMRKQIARSLSGSKLVRYTPGQRQSHRTPDFIFR